MKFKWKIEIDASQISITPLYLILNVLQLIRSDNNSVVLLFGNDYSSKNPKIITISNK